VETGFDGAAAAAAAAASCAANAAANAASFDVSGISVLISGSDIKGEFSVVVVVVSMLATVGDERSCGGADGYDGSMMYFSSLKKN
jgi:hypothetical protein